MDKKIKYLFVALFVVVVCSAATVYIKWNKPKRNVANEKGVEVTAAQIIKEYQSNENSANSTYLDKAIVVTGQVNEMKTNQEGKPTVTIAGEDPMTSVFCTLKETTDVKVGATVAIKGICSGMLSDVRLREAVVVKQAISKN